jgi:hypothetical protein
VRSEADIEDVIERLQEQEVGRLPYPKTGYGRRLLFTDLNEATCLFTKLVMTKTILEQLQKHTKNDMKFVGILLRFCIRYSHYWLFNVSLKVCLVNIKIRLHNGC